MYNEELTKLIDLRIFIDTPLDVCLYRRLKRDISIRFRNHSVGRALEVWAKNVRPGYEKYIAPSAKRAHIIIPEDPDGKMRKVAVEAMKDMIVGILCKKES